MHGPYDNEPPEPHSERVWLNDRWMSPEEADRYESQIDEEMEDFRLFGD